MESLRLKAKDRNISLEEMDELDANYMLNKRIRLSTETEE